MIHAQLLQLLIEIMMKWHSYNVLLDTLLSWKFYLNCSQLRVIDQRLMHWNHSARFISVHYMPEATWQVIDYSRCIAHNSTLLCINTGTALKHNTVQFFMVYCSASCCNTVWHSTAIQCKAVHGQSSQPTLVFNRDPALSDPWPLSRIGSVWPLTP